MISDSVAPMEITARNVESVQPSSAKRRKRKVRNSPQSRSPSHHADLRDRAREIVETEIQFIHNVSFQASNADALILGDPWESIGLSNRSAEPTRTSGSDGPAYFSSLYDRPLLSAPEERLLFRRMNYLLYRANLVRTSVDPEFPRAELISEFDDLLAQAEQCRERLIHCNLRLVVSIARRFAEDASHLEDLISEGHVALINAVAKFDFARGFRFSTYATHAVQRTYFRSLKRRTRDRQRFPTVGHEIVLQTDESPEDADPMQVTFDRFNSLVSLIQEQLDPRERFILEARFGLDRPEGPQTLLHVAKQMDLSKERVRQLQLRAIAKLRDESAARGLDTEPI